MVYLADRGRNRLEKSVRLVYNTSIFPGSSMVEQEAVNFEVAGSSPAPGATKK